MRTWICLILASMLLCFGAAAEELKDLTNFAEEYGVHISIENLPDSVAEIPDSIDTAAKWALRQVRAPLEDALARLRYVLLPTAMAVLLRAARSGRRGGMEVVLRLTLLIGCVRFIQPAIDAANACLARAIAFSDSAAPILSAVLAGTGMTGSAAMMQPLAAMTCNLFERWYMNAGMTLAKCATCLAIADGLSESIDLSGILRLIRKAINWGAGMTTAAFAALLSIGGAYAAGADSVLIRTVKYAVDSAASAIGGTTDAWGSYVSGMAAIRGSAGISGAATLLAVCFAPLATVACGMLLLGGLSALLRLTGNGMTAGVFEHLAGVIQCVLLLCCSAVGIVFLLIGACASLGGTFL